MRKTRENFTGMPSLWPSLRRMARSCRSRRLVASAFVGQGASELLTLHKGDVLLCAMSEQNVKAGLVDPKAIRTLQKKGVRVYWQGGLHEKVYLMGRAAMVCSANLSRRSARLDEAGLVTRDPKEIRAIREWIDRRLVQPVTPEWLKHCDRIYKPPQWEPGESGGRGESDGDHGRVWLIGVGLVDFPDDELEAAQHGRGVARRRLHAPRRYQIEEIRFAGSYRFLHLARRGDIFIQIWDQKNGSPRMVCPLGTLLNIKRTKSARGSAVSYIYLELPKKYRRIAFEKFKRLCASVGLRLGADVRAHEIRDRATANDVCAFVSHDKLALR